MEDDATTAVADGAAGGDADVDAIGLEAASELSLWREVNSQLFSAYRPGLSWYGPFNLLRRLLLVAVFATVAGVVVWPVLALLCFLLLALHQVVRPYRRDTDNRHETVALLSLSTIASLLAIIPRPA